MTKEKLAEFRNARNIFIFCGIHVSRGVYIFLAPRLVSREDTAPFRMCAIFITFIIARAPEVLPKREKHAEEITDETPNLARLIYWVNNLKEAKNMCIDEFRAQDWRRYLISWKSAFYSEPMKTALRE